MREDARVLKNWRKINCWAQIITRRSRYGFWWFVLNNWFFFNFLTPAHPHAQSLFLFPIVFGINLLCDSVWLEKRCWWLFTGSAKKFWPAWLVRRRDCERGGLAAILRPTVVDARDSHYQAAYGTVERTTHRAKLIDHIRIYHVKNTSVRRQNAFEHLIRIFSF